MDSVNVFLLGFLLAASSAATIHQPYFTPRQIPSTSILEHQAQTPQSQFSHKHSNRKTLLPFEPYPIVYDLGEPAIGSGVKRETYIPLRRRLQRRRRDLSDLEAVPPAELLSLKSLQNLGSLLAGIVGVFFGPFGPIISAVVTPFLSDIVYAVAGYMS